MLQDMLDLNTPLRFQEIPDVLDRFTYPVSCVSTDCITANEIDGRISKVRNAFVNIRHLWRQKGLSLIVKGHVYKTTM